MEHTINGALRLEAPDEFLPMTAEEMTKMFNSCTDDRWSAWARERHAMIAVAWKKYNALLLGLADLKAIAKKNQQLTQKAHAGYDYQPLGAYTPKAASVPMEGYRFAYRAAGAAQQATTVLLKHQRIVYSIMFIGREENIAADQALFEEVLSGLRLV